MKKAVSIPVVIAAIGLVVVLLAFVMNKAVAPAPGPDPNEALKHMGVQSIQAAKAAGPPPGPPEPKLPPPPGK